jgi:hypothetical protein
VVAEVSGPAQSGRDSTEYLPALFSSRWGPAAGKSGGRVPSRRTALQWLQIPANLRRVTPRGALPRLQRRPRPTRLGILRRPRRQPGPDLIRREPPQPSRCTVHQPLEPPLPGPNRQPNQLATPRERPPRPAEPKQEHLIRRTPPVPRPAILRQRPNRQPQALRCATPTITLRWTQCRNRCTTGGNNST